MNIRDKIEEKFQKLLQEAKEILSLSGWDGKEYRTFPPHDAYFRWRTETLNLLKRICGTESEHYIELRRLAEDDRTKNNSYYFIHCLGIVEAAHRDFVDDFLFDVRTLVRAELLDDFLGQAEYLLEEGFHIPAASLAGAVLEDTLRKMCDMRGLSYPENTKIDRLNADLAKANAYDKLVQKEITAKADLRNKADHGLFDKVGQADVQDMIRWIRRFVTEHLQ